jgi:hypothetical protein
MDALRYRETPVIMQALDRLETDERLKVDTSLLAELQSYTEYSKSLRDISAARYKTREDLHRLAEPYEEVQFSRGRVLRIKTGHLPVQRVLKRVWAACTTALYEIPEVAKLSPAPRRDAMMVAVLEPLRERLDDCDLVIETATEVEKLLANAHFTLKELRNINEAFLEELRRDRNR